MPTALREPLFVLKFSTPTTTIINYVLLFSFTSFAKEPMPTPQTYSNQGNPSKYPVYNTSMGTASVQQPYTYNQYAPPSTVQYPPGTSTLQDGMVSFDQLT